MESPGSLSLICTAAVLQPIVTDQLITKLRELFPAAVNRSMSPRDLDILIGQQEVIGYLEQLLEEQKADPLALEDI